MNRPAEPNLPSAAAVVNSFVFEARMRRFVARREYRPLAVAQVVHVCARSRARLVHRSVEPPLEARVVFRGQSGLGGEQECGRGRLRH